MGYTQSQLKAKLNKECNGHFLKIDNELFYCIENYDLMDNFFMTITSASDVWNTLWSKGGITAGRIDCDHGIFPYYTADKVADGKDFTGSYTAILVKKTDDYFIWEPFSKNSEINYKIKRNLYKNTSGSKVYFEEINQDLNLTFKYGWTSSDKFGLVKHSIITNNGSEKVSIIILDGCRNILPAGCDANFQNVKSVLLDAYKKTDFDEKSGIALFSLSSVPTDKAEPSEGLFANVSWFTTDGTILTDDKNIENFILGKPVTTNKVLKGGRPACFILKDIELDNNKMDNWYQIFDTFLTADKVKKLQAKMEDKTAVTKELVDDIQTNLQDLEQLIAEADGVQTSNDINAAVHHKANVLFNIMRGGIFADNGDILLQDFVKFIGERNRFYVSVVEQLLNTECRNKSGLITYKELESIIKKSENPQLERLFLEYMPLIFSRRHGDPSRPWNRFSIKISDENKNRIFNYEGNWRDIFQNWEALCMSYPVYTKNVIAKFLNAMTIDGYNPYRISRDGIDWEILDPTDPWSNIGYWGDHQVIYLQKMLELEYKLNPNSIFEMYNKKIFSTSNVPYRLKSYEDILKNPRSTILFEKELSDRLLQESAANGTDAKLVRSGNETADVELVSMFTKVIQIILTKLANYIPAGGIWLNCQRPSWNDACNAVVGYGLSMVTLCYLYRMIEFLKKTIKENKIDEYTLPEETATFFSQMANLYKNSNPSDLRDWTNSESCKARKVFVDKQEKFFEEERVTLYNNGHSKKEVKLSKNQVLEALESFNLHLNDTIRKNKRKDGLYNAYNIIHFKKDSLEISDLILMLEGQVAVLSSGCLSSEEALELTKLLKESSLYVADRNSYILYPNKELPMYWEKNNFTYDLIKDLPAATRMIETCDRSIFTCEDFEPKDSSICHFNANFKNVEFMKEAFADIDAKKPGFLSTEDKIGFENAYEKTFNHISFIGRATTFYAYEGLGSIYWHMVAKLMLAVQEYIPLAEDKTKEELIAAYYSIRSGIGFNKTPCEYGAFPTDPYSHTPEGQGAKQPGMTGQVKEEIITRWSELGMEISDGCILFNPQYLQEKEYTNGKISFTRFGINFNYVKDESKSISVEYINGKSDFINGNKLSSELSNLLFNRSKEIKEITITL